jgi:hypothetical protein
MTGGALAPTPAYLQQAFDYSEYDLYTSLTYDVGFATFGVQYQYYGYPDTYSGSFQRRCQRCGCIQ